MRPSSGPGPFQFAACPACATLLTWGIGTLLLVLYFHDSDLGQVVVLSLSLAGLLTVLLGCWIFLAYRLLREQRDALERERDRRNALIVDSAADAIITFNYHGRIESFNAAASRLFGYEPTEVIGQDITMLIQSAANIHLDSYVRSTVPSGPGFVLTGGTHFQARTRTGKLIPIELGVSKVLDEDRHLYIQIIRDLTERERLDRCNLVHAEVARLLGSDEPLSVVGTQILAVIGEAFHWSLGMLWLVDPDGKSLSYGAGWSSDGSECSYLLHARRNPLSIGSGIAGLALKLRDFQQSSDLLDDPPLPLGDHLRSGIAWPARLRDEILAIFEFRGTDSSPLRETLLHCLNPVATQLAQYLKRGLDQRALRHAKDLAEQVSRSKSELLSNVSHELRNPLNGILGLSELLRSEANPVRQTEYLDLIRSSVNTLLALVNDLLDLGKIEAARMTLEQSTFDLRAILEPTLRTQALHAEHKGLKFQWLIHADVPALLVGDPLRLQQIFLNLVGNAIKFTPQGEIQVRIAVSARTLREVILHGVVTDTGIGIPPDKQDLIFEAFYQASRAHDQTFAGTGLGLTITSRLIGLMGGRIWVQSTPGKGSSFHFTICLGLPAPSAAPTSDKVSSTDSGLRTPPPGTPFQRRLLVAEDNPVNRVLLEMLLQKRNHEVTFVGTGIDVLTQCRDKRFDLILMDVQLPEMDGIEATRRLREQHVSDGQAPPVIIGLTAHTSDEIRRRCLEAGMLSCISKPIQPGELLRVVDNALKGPA